MPNKHFHRELEKVKKMIIELGTRVEERVHLVSKAIPTQDLHIAKRIIDTDYEIDEMEVELEEECLKILALYQPVAVDLRFIIVMIKINNEMERIGDEAVNIARRIKSIAESGCTTPIFDYSVMMEKTEIMLKKSLDSLVHLDVDMARRVCHLDSEVDILKDNAYSTIRKSIKENTGDIDSLINFYLIARHIERLADHSTNIAEEVIYLIDGEIVRHMGNNKCSIEN